jgi:alpha-tubulin suppressor-like RCC1 family protein
MASSFYSNGENFDRIFFTDTQLIDRYIGNRAFGTGANLIGGLGDGTAVSKSSFVDFSGLGSNWKQVSAAVISTTTSFGAGVKTDGTLWTWGVNSLGQLGNASTVSRSSPAQTSNTTTDWSRVTTGTGFTAALKLDGSLWTWGFNTQGQLGTGNTTNRSTAQVVIVSGSVTNNSWYDIASSQYWAGSGHTLGLKTDGSLWAWGFNANGQLGDGSTINKSTPTQVAGSSFDWYKIAAGGQSSAAIKNNGTLWTWGRNAISISSIPVGTGVLGDGSTTDRSSPGSVVGGGSIWKQVSISTASSTHMAGVKLDGTLWTWGSNTNGRLGDGSTSPRSSPATVAGGGTNWDHVSCGYGHTGAIKTDGSLWTWGTNSQGNLGTGNITGRSSPGTIVGGVAEWTAVSCSGSTDGAGANINETLGIALFIGGG